MMSDDLPYDLSDGRSPTRFLHGVGGPMAFVI